MTRPFPSKTDVARLRKAWEDAYAADTAALVDAYAATNAARVAYFTAFYAQSTDGCKCNMCDRHRATLAAVKPGKKKSR